MSGEKITHEQALSSAERLLSGLRFEEASAHRDRLCNYIAQQRSLSAPPASADERTVRSRRNAGDSDVVCPETLPAVFIEVKSDKRAIVGGKFLDDTMDKAEGQCGQQFPAVLWREPGSGWRLYAKFHGVYGNFTHEAIGQVLRWAQETTLTPRLDGKA